LEVFVKKVTAFIIILALLALIVPAVGAQPSSYNAGFQVANLSSTDATISVVYYNQDGSVATTVNDTVPGDGSVTYFPIAAAAGFNGSVVISSDQPVAAIANVLGDGTAFGASYESFDSGAQVVSLPLVSKNNFGFSTWFNVQNTGTSSTTVNVTYAGTSCTDSATIAPGAAATISQDANACLPSGHKGAATLTASSGGTIVATVMQTAPAQLLAYNGFTGGTTNPVMPLVQANNFGYITGIQIQNVGNASTNVTVSYTAGAVGSNCTETKTIAAGDAGTFALSASCTTISGAKPRFVGGAAVTGNTASQDLVAIVNQTNLTDKGAAYNGIDTTAATDTVNFPLIMQANFGYFTGFNVYNAGGSATDVTCTFSSGVGTTPTSFTQNIASGSVYTSVQTGAARYVGAVTCTAASGTIVGVANELCPNTGDTFFAYGAFSQ
jgi:hypothetical protein